MKISLQWIADFLPGPLDAAAIADALTGGGFPVESIEPHGDDTILDVEVTSNRGDCLSQLGMARELSALLNRPMKDDSASGDGGKSPSGGGAIDVRIESPSCSIYTAQIIRGVRIGPSPAWMARRLTAVGVRPINNVVDVTNYVMFEIGQPLHAFDLAKIGGGRIIVRQARAGEKIVSIDGHERSLSTGMLVIADTDRPVALAGVMGGRDSEVSDATVDLLLESARFDPVSVRTTARALQMRSESSYRFERGIDPTLPIRAARRATALIVQTAGGTGSGPTAVAGESVGPPRTLELRLARIAQVLGIEVPAQDAVAILRRLGLSPRLEGHSILVTVPSWRADLNLEIDLVEEVARVAGYERIPVRDEISIRVAPPEPSVRAIASIRQALIAAGYYEAITFSFVSDALADDFIEPGTTLPRVSAVTRGADARLRPSLIPGLLESLARNEANGNDSVRLFEIGSTFVRRANSGDAIDERRRLSLAGGGDVRDVRGAVEALLQRLDGTRQMRVVPDGRPGFAGSACGRIEWGGKPIGWLGRINRAIHQKLGLRATVVAAELELAELLAGARAVPRLAALPRFPAVRRDVAFVVEESVEFERLRATIERHRPPTLEGVEFVSTYRGKPIEPGKKSVAVAFLFRATDATLTAAQVEPEINAMITAAGAELGATVRQ
jgi:phenylalanyl-tRNA synthetase beta chain